jgi:hypothetical protein
MVHQYSNGIERTDFLCGLFPGDVFDDLFKPDPGPVFSLVKLTIMLCDLRCCCHALDRDLLKPHPLKYINSDGFIKSCF